MLSQPPLNPDGVEAAKEAMRRVLELGLDEPRNLAWESIPPAEYPDAVTKPMIAAYLAAALPELRSVQELDQLPVESVVRDSAGIVYENDLFDQTQDYKWARMASGGNYPTRAIILPARVLYRPEVNDA